MIKSISVSIKVVFTDSRVKAAAEKTSDEVEASSSDNPLTATSTVGADFGVEGESLNEGTIDEGDSAPALEDEDYYEYSYYEDETGVENVASTADANTATTSSSSSNPSSKAESTTETSSSTSSTSTEAASSATSAEPEKPKEPTAAEIIEEAKKKEEIKAKKEQAKRLKKSGFVRQKGMGYTFPGVDPKQVDTARKSRKNNNNQKEEEMEEIPDPKMYIGPMSTRG